MFILYDLIFFIFALCYLPVFLLKRKFHKGFMTRFGFPPAGAEFRHPIWIHAVSVGEMIAMRPLIAELRKAYPDKKLVISTVTATGNKIAKSEAQEGDTVVYLPLDIRCAVGKFVDRINPSVFIAAETEIWPNLISYLCEKKIPFIVVNGRISDASFKGYRLVKFLLKNLLNKITLFCVQSETDRQRLLALGLAEDKIVVTGNIKFDIIVQGLRAADRADYREKLGLRVQDKLLVAGSTHPGEEQAVLNVYRGLRNDFPGLKIVLAPRHPDRAKEIGDIVSQYGFEPIYISRLTRIPQTKRNSASSDGLMSSFQADRIPVFILDTIGQLLSFYAISDIVFVGGSLIKKGGHNILEPAAFGKPVIFGPYMFNFRDIASLFVNQKAAIIVRSEEELSERIRFLLNNPEQMKTSGEAGKSLIVKNQGATVKNLEYIKRMVK